MFTAIVVDNSDFYFRLLFHFVSSATLIETIYQIELHAFIVIMFLCTQ